MEVEEHCPTYLLAQKTVCFGHKDNLNFQAWDRQNLHCAELKFEEE